MTTKLLIALDYDHTYTADPVCMTALVALLKGYGHTVVCVSARFNTLGNRRLIESSLPGTMVLLTHGMSKREWCKSQGYEIDIFIDDSPQSIPSLKEVEDWHKAKNSDEDGITA